MKTENVNLNIESNEKEDISNDPRFVKIGSTEKSDSYCARPFDEIELNKLPDKCRVKQYIIDNIENIRQQALQHREIDGEHFDDYIASEIAMAHATMTKYYLRDKLDGKRFYKYNPNQQYRCNHIYVYLWNEERIKILNNIFRGGENEDVIARYTKRYIPEFINTNQKTQLINFINTNQTTKPIVWKGSIPELVKFIWELKSEKVIKFPRSMTQAAFIRKNFINKDGEVFLRSLENALINS